MKIATWNVNSLKVRLPQVLDWLATEEPDVLALQETKLTDDNFPELDIQAAGYHAVYSGQKTYNGVAILSRQPADAVLRDVPDFDDPQRRFLAATVAGMRVINLYVVNGQAVDSDKYAYKLAWLKAVGEHLANLCRSSMPLVVLGDFNIAPKDEDVHDPAAWRDRILCSKAERSALAKFTGLGLTDTFRLFPQAEKSFSWWDYRAAAFRRNLGLRIDLILANPSLAAQCTACVIDTGPRKLERPSDHAPVVAEFELWERNGP
ncbi:MAG: exodeoxyribonuclease III [Gammaproteobacteria bacterium]|nr:MAG: exodeoxyribonuclease III [Gammaproteobacteria bacterium]